MNFYSRAIRGKLCCVLFIFSCLAAPAWGQDMPGTIEDAMRLIKDAKNGVLQDHVINITSNPFATKQQKEIFSLLQFGLPTSISLQLKGLTAAKNFDISLAMVRKLPECLKNFIALAKKHTFLLETESLEKIKKISKHIKLDKISVWGTSAYRGTNFLDPTHDHTIVSFPLKTKKQTIINGLVKKIQDSSVDVSQRPLFVVSYHLNFSVPSANDFGALLEALGKESLYTGTFIYNPRAYSFVGFTINTDAPSVASSVFSQIQS